MTEAVSNPLAISKAPEKSDLVRSEPTVDSVRQHARSYTKNPNGDAPLSRTTTFNNLSQAIFPPNAEEVDNHDQMMQLINTITHISKQGQRTTIKKLAATTGKSLQSAKIRHNEFVHVLLKEKEVNFITSRLREEFWQTSRVTRHVDLVQERVRTGRFQKKSFAIDAIDRLMEHDLQNEQYSVFLRRRKTTEMQTFHKQAIEYLNSSFFGKIAINIEKDLGGERKQDGCVE